MMKYLLPILFFMGAHAWADSLSVTGSNIEMTQLVASAATTNYQNADTARDSTGFPVARHRTILIRALRSAVVAGLPVGYVIDSGAVYITAKHGTATGTATANLYKSLKLWEEAEATWNLAYNNVDDGDVNWTLAGGTGSGTDRASSAESNNTVSTSNDVEYRWSVTQATAADWVSSSLNFGFVMDLSTSNRGVTWYSDDAGSNTPHITVYYHILAGTRSLLDRGIRGNGIALGARNGLNR